MSATPLQSLVAAIRSGDAEAVRTAIRSQPQLVHERPEHAPSLPLLAVYHGYPQVAALLVEAGASVTIFEAAAMGLLERARAFLEADPGQANAYNQDGFQPLGLACFFGHTEVARLLLERGAAVNSASRNAQMVTPLHSAVAAASPELVRALLEAGADAGAAQQGGYTPLHEAARQGHGQILSMLLDAGADATVKADDGSTPLDLAVRAGHAEAAQLIEGSAAL